MRIRETLSAGRAKLGRADALRLARASDRVTVSRGKKVVVFDMKKEPPAEAALLRAMLGPTGNLRAPALRRGQTLLVGFNADVYEEVFG